MGSISFCLQEKDVSVFLSDYGTVQNREIVNLYPWMNQTFIVPTVWPETYSFRPRISKKNSKSFSFYSVFPKPFFWEHETSGTNLWWNSHYEAHLEKGLFIGRSTQCTIPSLQNNSPPTRCQTRFFRNYIGNNDPGFGVRRRSR